jgi:hypothetical protein
MRHCSCRSAGFHKIPSACVVVYNICRSFSGSITHNPLLSHTLFPLSSNQTTEMRPHLLQSSLLSPRSSPGGRGNIRPLTFVSIASITISTRPISILPLATSFALSSWGSPIVLLGKPHIWSTTFLRTRFDFISLVFRVYRSSGILTSVNIGIASALLRS